MVSRKNSQRRPRGQHDPAYGLLCELVRQAREEANLTQRDLGQLLGRAQTYIWKCEQGERRMDPIEVIRWANACKRDYMEIFRQLGLREAQTDRR